MLRLWMALTEIRYSNLTKAIEEQVRTTGQNVEEIGVDVKSTGRNVEEIGTNVKSTAHLVEAEANARNAQIDSKLFHLVVINISTYLHDIRGKTQQAA